MKQICFTRNYKKWFTAVKQRKKDFNPLVCLLLSIILAFSSIVTFFADDNVSSADRIVTLTTKNLDGNFTNNDNINQNKYELEVQKTSNRLNEICMEYTINEFSNEDDIASEIEVLINNVSLKDVVLTVNDTNAINGNPLIITNGNTTKLTMHLNREYASTLEKVIVNIPFKLIQLEDMGDIIINLKSPSNKIISYTWNTVLIDTIENPEDLSEFDKFNNGTYFKNASMKTAKGFYHTIPIKVMSKSNEEETFITLEHPAFYFKNYDGSWRKGKGIQKLESLHALTPKTLDFLAFQTEDTITPMKLKVNTTDLTSTMQLSQTRIILDMSATNHDVILGQKNQISAVLNLETPFTSNNSFRVVVHTDSSKFDFDTIDSGATQITNQSVSFKLPYKTKKAFHSGIVSLDIVTEFNGITYTIASEDFTISSKEETPPVLPTIKDYSIEVLPKINTTKNGTSTNSYFTLINDSEETAVIKVKLESSDSKVTLESTHLGFNIESDKVTYKEETKLIARLQYH